MRHYSLFIAATCLLVFLTSCEKKDYSSFPPSFEGFKFSRNDQPINKTDIYAGDRITVTAAQMKKGQLINATTYNWEVIIPVEQADGSWKNDTIKSGAIHKVYDMENEDPSFTFNINSKAVGTSIVKFNATYSFSGNGIQVDDGSNYGSSGTASGSIVSSSSAMYGKANGSVRFTVKEK